LDFSTTLQHVDPLEEALLTTLKEIELEGIHAEIQEAKKTTGGYLAIVVFTIGTDKVIIRLEVSLREGDKRGVVETIVSDFIPPYTITALAKNQLVGEKMQALLTRKKPRDFYDLYYMIRANMITPEEKSILPQAMKVVQATTVNFDRELKQFLPKSQRSVIREFRVNLEREIKRFL